MVSITGETIRKYIRENGKDKLDFNIISGRGFKLRPMVAVMSMKSQKSMIKSMIIKPDNLTKIMSIILHDPLCYDHSNYHSLN